MTKLTPNQVEKRNNSIITEYEKRLKDGAVNKTKLAAEFDISPRTLNRILSNVGLHKENKTTATTITKDKPKKDPKKVLADSDKTPKKSRPKAPVKKPETAEPEVADKADTPTESTNEKRTIISATIDPGSFITLLLDDGDSLAVTKEHPKYQDIALELTLGNNEKALELASIKIAAQKYLKGNFRIENDQFFMNDTPIKNNFADDLIDAFTREEPFEHLLKFFENIQACPSLNIYERIWTFIKKAHIEITDKGNVVCYKKVDNDFMDLYSNTIFNGVGETVTMLRSSVVEDPDQTCSRGLHVSAPSYLSSYGADTRIRVIKCIVRPQDFVSIPSDYDHTKVRVCSYKVIEDVTDQYRQGKLK